MGAARRREAGGRAAHLLLQLRLVAHERDVLGGQRRVALFTALQRVLCIGHALLERHAGVLLLLPVRAERGGLLLKRADLALVGELADAQADAHLLIRVRREARECRRHRPQPDEYYSRKFEEARHVGPRRAWSGERARLRCQHSIA